MATSSVEVSSDTTDRGLQLNQDLVNQLNELVQGGHADSECWSSSRPVLVEGLLWSILGAVLWMVTLYIVS
ncbi:hypothetical protein SAMN05192563_101596 [Paraburkholderia aspalathi]|jgi:hypothetical protein|uniref:Uncharacterized protein n=1 Tax=Paraburkholderia aspalathi TaxID=1324617 RepID=A0A1I7EA37_9BURK|nr:hypothetical protein SAMN05192563_101596 [Paraburkholderia aspalathi]